MGVNLSADGKSVPESAPSSSKTAASSKDGKDSAPNSPAHTPALDARTKFGANLFLLSGIELAHVIMTLEQECPNALEHVKEEVQLEDDPNDESNAISPKLEINVDEISHGVFQELSAYVIDKVGSKGHSDAKVDDITASRPSKKKQRKN